MKVEREARTVPFHPTAFVNKVKAYTPGAILSIGWSSHGRDGLTKCSPRHPTHSVLVLATSSTTFGLIYQCSPRHPPHSRPV